VNVRSAAVAMPRQETARRASSPLRPPEYVLALVRADAPASSPSTKRERDPPATESGQREPLNAVLLGEGWGKRSSSQQAMRGCVAAATAAQGRVSQAAATNALAFQSHRIRVHGNAGQEAPARGASLLTVTGLCDSLSGCSDAGARRHRGPVRCRGRSGRRRTPRGPVWSSRGRCWRPSAGVAADAGAGGARDWAGQDRCRRKLVSCRRCWMTIGVPEEGSADDGPVSFR